MAAFLSSVDAGGVLVINVNDLSVYTVMITGVRHAAAALRAGVKRLAELHDIHAALTERRTDRRSRIGLTGGNLKLDVML